MKKRVVWLLLLCILLPASSCKPSDSQQPCKYDYSSTTVMYSEQPDGTFAFIKEMYHLKLNGVAYYFEQSITSEERDSCVETTQRVLEKIDRKTEINIYVYSSETYSDTYIKDGNIYICEQSWNSPQYISCILMGVFGEFCNYGLVYGYSNYLLSLLNNDKIGQTDFIWDEKTDTSLLDMNLLCFDSSFASQESIVNTQKIATAFVLHYIDEYGIGGFHDLLTSSGDIERSVEFREALALFYSLHGISYTPTSILYTCGGHSYDYIARGEYAFFYIGKNWRDAMDDLNPLTYDGFLHRNYREAKEFFEINTSQMGQYQSLFGFDSYNNDLCVYFTNNNQSTRNSYYQPQTHSIYLKNADSLMHEYIHSVTLDKVRRETNWNTEGVARYFSYRYDHYGIAMLNVDYNQDSDSKELLYVREYKENIGRDIDMAVDYREIENIAVFSRDLFDPNKTYVSGSSFVGFLVAQLGEQETIDLIFSENGLNDASYRELAGAWKQYITTNYSNYSKYK